MKSLNKTRRLSEQGESIDLDVTPIMNLFVILIPFLVSMAVFTHFSNIEFSLPANAAVNSGGPKDDKLKLTLVLNPYRFKITRGAEVLASGQPSQIQKVLRSFSGSSQEIAIASSDEVKFESIITTMDTCKKLGFNKIALSQSQNDSKLTKGDLP